IKRTNGDASSLWLAGALAILHTFNSMCDGVSHQMNQRIRDLLDNIIVELCFSAFFNQFHWLAANFRGVARGSREARVQIADGHHARLREPVLQMMRKLGELVDVHANASDKSAELGNNFGNVRGNFSE